MKVIDAAPDARPLTRDPGSYRDPRGFVFEFDGKVCRSVAGDAAADLQLLLRSPTFDRLRHRNAIVKTSVVHDHDLHAELPGWQSFVEHQRLPFISYPYEWPFDLLKRAALLHLDIQREALRDGLWLSDASAYNVQFLGPDPIFIDVLSFRKYREGEIWAGHQQFLNQFLNPLLLEGLVGLPFQNWYRGSVEGIESTALAALIPWRKKFSFNVLAHVLAPARMDRRVRQESVKAIRTAQKLTLPKAHYLGLIGQLRDCIERLEPRNGAGTSWANYDRDNTYADPERQAKAEFITRFCARTTPDMLVDIGCNTGEYAEIALGSGAKRAIGLDFDVGALRKACHRAITKSLALTPLFQDATNPSPGQGWRNTERKPLADRGRFDAVLALAVEHHLAIARNVPLEDVVDWLVGWAPCGIIEFVPKSDPTVQTMLALRDDVFAHYSQQAFEAALTSRARIVDQQQISTSGRTLYAFERI